MGGHSRVEYVAVLSPLKKKSPSSTPPLDEANNKWALDQFDQALKIDELCLDAFLGKGYVLGLMDKMEEALDILLEAKEHYPEEQQIDEMLAMVAGDDDDSDEEGDEHGHHHHHHHHHEHDHDGHCCDGDHDHDHPQNNADVSKLVKATENALEPLPRFVEVLKEIWARFNPTSKDETWTDKALSDFHLAVNGTPIADTSIGFLKENFETNANNLLTHNGFVGFYVYQSAVRELINASKQVLSCCWGTRPMVRKLGKT